MSTTPADDQTSSVVITKSQYRAAVTALGLDPDLLVSITMAGTYAHVTQVATTPDGNPKVHLGELVRVSYAADIVDDDADEEVIDE